MNGGRGTEGGRGGGKGWRWYPADKQQSCHIARWISSAAQSDIVCMCLRPGRRRLFFSFSISSRMESVFPASLTTAYTLYLQPSKRIFDECLTCSSETRYCTTYRLNQLMSNFFLKKKNYRFFHMHVFLLYRYWLSGEHAQRRLWLFRFKIIYSASLLEDSKHEWWENKLFINIFLKISDSKVWISGLIQTMPLHRIQLTTEFVFCAS